MRDPALVIDRTHLGRRASGIERITRDLFSDDALGALQVRGTKEGAGRLTTLLRQMLVNPLDALRRPESVWVFSGFPPSPVFGWLSERSVLYVHDLFLIERRGELNRAARLYLAPNFRLALHRFRWFLANSVTTAQRLRPYVSADATIALYRPHARDVLGLGSLEVAAPPPAGPVRIGMIGTIEPRKNYPAAIAIREALAVRLGRAVELHIVGRSGWGPDVEVLAKAQDVHLHGFVDDERIAALVAQWTLFLSTSHDEGLGLPLLEIQHAGLPIVTPDGAVFREVLEQSGTYIDPRRPQEAADTLATLLDRGAGDQLRHAAHRNLARWNDLAAADHAAVLALLADRLASVRRG